MHQNKNRAVMLWTLSFGAFVVLLIAYGGFVRLSRSGLSIVDWRPVSGILPPLTQQAWQEEFSKYQATPEYQQINSAMNLPEYRRIFYIEWFHRILARLAGLVFVVPFLIFLATGRIPLKDVGIYVAMGCLFAAQALMGWIMVASGLVDRPSVSQFALAGHLFLALALVGASTWTVLNHRLGAPHGHRRGGWSRESLATVVGLGVLLVQIAYGAFAAGLRAGHVSDSWPLMLGRWIPRGLLSQIEPAALNLVSAPLTVAFIHRWYGLAALIAGAMAYSLVKRAAKVAEVRLALAFVSALSVLQFALGIAVVVSRVGIVLALWHQVNAIFLFVAVTFLLHGLRARDLAGEQSAGVSTRRVASGNSKTARG
jgi:cytochrome c oxidase assembly protein subunit 15